MTGSNMPVHLSGTTMVLGVIGDPIAHTFSPPMQNAAIEAMGADAVYVPFHVRPDRLEDAIKGIVSLGVRGINVTVPHKTAVIQYCDHLTDVAGTVGAVNTIINDDGVLTGENTDAYGFEASLLNEAGIDVFPSKVCVLGAGGAARGVVYACAVRPEVEEMYVVNRTLGKAESLAADIAGAAGTKIVPLPAVEKTYNDIIPGSGLVVNTTSIGMHPDINASPLPDHTVLHDGQIVCDIIYNPLETVLLREAAAHGAIPVNGLGMLAYQGARALSLWIGRDAPVDVMYDILKKRFTS